jgi:hypothetical protein
MSDGDSQEGDQSYSPIWKKGPCHWACDETESLNSASRVTDLKPASIPRENVESAQGAGVSNGGPCPGRHFPFEHSGFMLYAPDLIPVRESEEDLALDS